MKPASYTVQVWDWTHGRQFCRHTALSEAEAWRGALAAADRLNEAERRDGRNPRRFEAVTTPV